MSLGPSRRFFAHFTLKFRRQCGRHVAQLILRLTLPLLGFVGSAQAADITWNGLYRVEGVQVQNSEMSSTNTDKAYMLHHLILNPKLTMGDGLTIYSRLDILNSSSYGINSSNQVTSVAGDLLGNGPGTAVSTTSAPNNGTDSNAWGKTENAGQIAVTEMYLSWAQEFGQLIIGRVPLQFGLGIAYSAGNGLFDHYISTKDLVAYKFVFGNLFVMPIKAKVNEGSLNTMNDVDDYMVQVEYNNPDTELSLGFMYDIHVVTGNDSPIGASGGTAGAGAPFIGGPGATRTGSFSNTLMSFYFSEKPASVLRTSVEFDLAQGSTGVQTATLQNTSLNAYGLAAELAWLPHPDSKWSGKLKAGLSTGSDPGTWNVDEGFQFNRNYHVAQLMFHQPLGQADILRSGYIRNTNVASSAQLDTEAVSNALYISPNFDYQFRDNLSLLTTFVWARLNVDPMNVGTTTNAGTALDLGYEADFALTWKPMERVTWVNGFAALLPGSAWRGGNNNFENKMVFGLETKAAISF